MADGYIRGFFHYHITYPQHFLSGSIRFRCTRTSQVDAFLAKNGGVDLMGHHNIPWDISFTRLLTGTRYEPLLDRLQLDGFLSVEKLKQARRLLHTYNPISEQKRRGCLVQHVHEIGQPFIMDLTQPTRISVTAPHSVIPVDLYPIVATSGVSSCG
ncbi:hypothetical protein FB45DRAFT_898719 [Roridomyces roridus]|uniref:Uncharacterized protein n=1 Tax=Roridomyces roridus TaxID=1738132 RepID=A0AAD7FZ17_9AGAR|nr:hypothetical protein FB45DRAFT_898719 [Roridomyces roridus]